MTEYAEPEFPKSPSANFASTLPLLPCTVPSSPHRIHQATNGGMPGSLRLTRANGAPVPVQQRQGVKAVYVGNGSVMPPPTAGAVIRTPVREDDELREESNLHYASSDVTLPQKSPAQ